MPIIYEGIEEASPLLSAEAKTEGYLEAGIKYKITGLEAIRKTSTEMEAAVFIGGKMIASSKNSASMNAGLLITSVVLEAEHKGSTYAFGRINDEPNIFPDAPLEAERKTSASMSSLLITEAYLEAIRKTSASMSGLTINRTAENQLRMTIRVVPAYNTQFHKDAAKFYINDEQVNISDFTLTAPEDGSGYVLNVVLRDFKDKSKLLANGNYKFELGKRINGSWKWRTFIDGGKLKETAINFSLNNNQPADSINVVAVSSTAKKLDKVAQYDLVIYDNIKQKLSTNDFKPIFDLAGRSFGTELYAIPGMMLYDLFNEVLVNRCGFIGVKTNIINYPILESRIKSGERLYELIKPFLGPYSGEVYEVDGYAVINDETLPLAAGMPAPQKLLASRWGIVDKTQSASNADIDRLKVIYTVDDVSWDTVTRLTTTNEGDEVGKLFDDSYSKTVIATTKDYFYRTGETTPIDEKLIKEVQTTSGTFGDVIGRVTEDYFYDYLGRIVKTKKIIEALVPHFEGTEDAHLDLLETSSVIKETLYGPHPFDGSKQIITQIVEITKGLVGIDTGKPYRGESFKQELVTGYRSGNFEGSEIQTEYREIKKRTEINEITPRGEVRTRIKEEDLLNQVITNDYTEVRIADISTKAGKQTYKEVYVFENDDDLLTDKQSLDFPVGAIPITIFKPLAKRKLRQLKDFSANSFFDIKLGGLELYIDKGQVYNVIDPDNNTLGNFTTRAFTISGKNLETEQQTFDVAMRGKKLVN